MYKKILIANRGEIALRVIRACRQLGIKTVAIHSVADQASLHVKLADESVCVGPAEVSKSYLHVPSILSAAEVTGSDAIHPGYGFLAENHEFAERCEQCGVRFIGPTPKNIELMGNKIKAKQLVEELDIPTIPGSTTKMKSEKEAVLVANELGYPILLKAALGGGGRGMRVIHNENELKKSLSLVRNEVLAHFGNPDIYIEKYLEGPRHIEVQIVADQHGTVLHLGERECSLQRNYQKILEEAPCAFLDQGIREKILRDAVRIASTIQYKNVGTIEFLVSGQDYYFIEMNTRIQVEHPVTEMVTGIDLIKTQIQVSLGEALSWKQEDIHFNGHSMECRINAEDPETMMPFPGEIKDYHVPGGIGVRVDAALYDGCSILPYYDSLIAKLIVHGDNRAEVINKMKHALNEYIIGGIKTNIPLFKKILENPSFIGGEVNTSFLKRFLQKTT
ncbi:MAG: acetyl-CoA carboxylase biotin carboxylase subunit [Deltaproteobacteria bacterium]|nr:acetyl-CoA carboxylase biotin carboxylase subunit [Deltaproteobacteria bacterium]